MYVKSVHLNEYNMGIKIPESPNHFYSFFHFLGLSASFAPLRCL